MNISKYTLTAVLIGLLGVFYGAQNAYAKQPKKENNQQTLTETIVKANENAQKDYKQAENADLCRHCHQPLPPQDTLRHCPALKYVGVCAPQTPKKGTDVSADSYVCERCGHEYTQEEQRGHEQHVCAPQEATPQAPAQNAAENSAQTPAEEHAHHCIYCGEEITRDFQACQSPDRLSPYCTTHCPECGKDLRDPKNIGPDGTHHCRGKLTIKVTPVKK